MSSTFVLRGKWQDGASSASCSAQLTVVGDHVTVAPETGASFTVELSNLGISASIGRTPRYISFKSHSGQFECVEFDTLTTLDERIGSPAMRIIHKLENHLGLVVIATVTVLLMGFSYFYWGIPYASKVIAYTLPQGTLQQASDDTLLVMQKRYLQPTKLSAETQARLREKISDFAPDYPIDKLYFYASDSMGANAFALPDGTIVFTDEIIALTEGNDDEVLAVFGHEIGHIEGRHALRQILQSSAIAVTIAMIGGDVSAMGDIVLTLPVVFSQLAFSRKFEIEADQHSRAMLESNGLKSDAFASILTKLYNSHSQCEDSKIKCEKRKDWYRYLSTHPHLEQRLQAISQ